MVLMANNWMALIAIGKTYGIDVTVSNSEERCHKGRMVWVCEA